MHHASCLRVLVVGLYLAAAFITTPAGAGGEIVIDSVVLRPAIEAEVPARRVGVLAAIAVDEGQTVEQGQLLASLDDRAAALAVGKAEIERYQAMAKATNRLGIEYAAKASEVAIAELKRSEETNNQFPGSISQSQLDVERLTIEKLNLERRQAEHELELAEFESAVKGNALRAAELDLELHAVRAPFAGIISLVRVHAGEWVEPGAAVVRLVSVDTLRAEGFAPADKGSGSVVRVGAPVSIEVAGADGQPMSLQAEIGFVSPEVDPVSRQVRVWAAIDNRGRQLQPGQQGRMILLAPQ